MKRTVEDLVLMMLKEVPEGDEVSSTGLLINSLRSLEEAIEQVLQDFQLRDIVNRRWRYETQSLVYRLAPEMGLTYDHTNDTTDADTETRDEDDDDDPFKEIKQLRTLPYYPQER